MQGNEIEIFEDKEDSYFDKYLNEVLYLFENTEADVIVFEDMDRFDSNVIFERLREINTLTNIQLSKDEKSPIRFFYLLRDDIFISKDRTKFFDFTIPIIPVIDASNSYDQFIEHFKKGNIFDLFDEKFLQGLSLYVDDMRTLKNIYNEFIIYYNRLNTTELTCNKMLALITYKNIFPRDSSDLQLNKGFVYTLFANKEQFISNEITNLETQIFQKKDEIDQAKTEHLKSLDELNIIYNAKKTTNYYGRLNPLNEEDQKEFDKRKLAIENKNFEKSEELKKEISLLQNQIIAIKSYSLKNIITRENIDEVFKTYEINEIGTPSHFNEIKESNYFPLLKYLIRNGYIDETYSDYMTYFYPNSLCKTDKMFLRSITDKKAKEASYTLENPSLVVSRLNITDFDQEEILNFNLLEYLLENPIYQEFANRLINQLKNPKQFQFITDFFNREKNTPKFVEILNSTWPQMFSYALNNNSLSKEQLRLYSIYSLYYSNNEDIQKINIDNCLTQYISNSPDYLEIGEPKIDELINKFKLLSVSFLEIDNSDLNMDLFTAIYESSLYEINSENISLMLKIFYQLDDIETIRHQNYTLVLSQPTSPLAQYLNSNISKYIDVVLESCDGKLSDSESVAITILNNSDISDEQKESYITRLTTSIISINAVNNNELWTVLLSNKTATYSEENILEYFTIINELDETLIDFINSSDKKLDFTKSKTSYAEDTFKLLFNKSLICVDLLDEKYREILSSLDYQYENFSIEGIPDSKFKICIELEISQMTSNSLIFIREHYPSQNFYFIENNLELYVNLMTNELFSLDELEEIITWKVDDVSKLKLLEFTDDSISVINLERSSVIISHILNNNLDPNDLPFLFKSHTQWTSDVQQIIFRLAVKNIQEIIVNPLDVSNILVKQLLKSSKLSDFKIDLFVATLPNFSRTECIELIDILGLPIAYKDIFVTSKRPNFEINTLNKKLLSSFVKAEIIYDFPEDTRRNGYYSIQRNKPLLKKS